MGVFVVFVVFGQNMCYTLTLKKKYDCIILHVYSLRIILHRIFPLMSYAFVSLFACEGFYVSLENFSLIWRRLHDRRKAAKIGLYLKLMAIEHWEFFSVPRLLLHGASVYSGHLRGPVTLTPVAERLAVELSLPVSSKKNYTFRFRGERSNRLRHCCGY